MLQQPVMGKVAVRGSMIEWEPACQAHHGVIFRLRVIAGFGELRLTIQTQNLLTFMQSAATSHA